jgi:hypothetical protein
VAKKKSGSKHRARDNTARGAAKGRPAAGRATPPPELDVAPQPATEDPQAQAEWFISLLDAFAQHGSPEAVRLRRGLIETVNDYAAAEDKVAARVVAAARIAGLQAGVAEVVLRSTRKMRDRFVKESRRRGTSSKQGKSLRAAADGFSKMVEGLEMMAQAAEVGDEALSARGAELMEEARAAMEPHLTG